MKNFVKLLGFVIILFGFPMVASANSISKIDMDIYVDSEGDAHVTETWVSTATAGTEVYKSYYNLGNASISNFRVSEDGEYYESASFWDTSLSFDEKAYKSGIHYVSDGVELCWGVSEYGYHEYVLSYDIEGFAISLSDSDMVYWTLIPADLSPKPNDVYIKIYSDFDYSSMLDVWGYGNYGGTAYVYDGYIEMGSDGALSSDEYMTVLVKFDKGTFNTSNVIDKDFDYYYDMAQEGAVSYNSDASVIVPFMVFIAILLGVLILPKMVNKKNLVGSVNIHIKKEDKKIPKDIPNVREIPFDKDIYHAFWVAEAYGLNSKKTDFLGAILLKWLMEKKVSLKKVSAGLFKNKEETAIDFTGEFKCEDSLEEDLRVMLKRASKDGVLESKEFEKWCKENYEEILRWFDRVLDGETKKLQGSGKIVIEQTSRLFNTSRLVVDSSMKDDAIKLKGFKNFLEEFSRIDDKEAIEVSMWEYYLIYAQILGIADKVAKQFEKLYPEIIESPNYDFSYGDIVFINTMSYSAIHGASMAKASHDRAERAARASSYSSGGGGFSSGGGGGGSFGGGGGGGFR